MGLGGRAGRTVSRVESSTPDFIWYPYRYLAGILFRPGYTPRLNADKFSPRYLEPSLRKTGSPEAIQNLIPPNVK